MEEGEEELFILRHVLPFVLFFWVRLHVGVHVRFGVQYSTRPSDLTMSQFFSWENAGWTLLFLWVVYLGKYYVFNTIAVFIEICIYFVSCSWNHTLYHICSLVVRYHV